MKISEWIRNLFRQQPPKAEEVEARVEAESGSAESERAHDRLLGDGEQARRW